MKANLRKPQSSETGEGAAPNRRAFLKKFGLGLTAITAAAAVTEATTKAASETSHECPSSLNHPDAGDRYNHLERMRCEIHTALKKPVEKRHWIMVIDQQKCIGCRACTVSCVAENNLPPGVVYRPVTANETGTFPNVRKQFLPRPCMHCDNPPCVPVCPVSATFKRPDGVVAVDYDACMGCRYCIAACPYNARTADFGEFYDDGSPEIMDYEKRPTFEYGKERKRIPGKHNSPMGNARKCHFCVHRVENGILPACVTTCLGGATYFGDKNDPNSLVSELSGSNRTMRLKEEKGTDPQVIYLT